MRQNRKQEIADHVADCLEVANEALRVFMAEGYSVEESNRLVVAAVTSKGGFEAASLVIDALGNIERILLDIREAAGRR